MKKNILIATGGSGGHMMPALVIHDHLKKNFNLSISSDERGLKFINHKKYDLFIVNTPRISKDYFFVLFKIIKIFTLMIYSLFYIKRKKIDLIISTGGYSPIPICLAGIILKKKIYLYEPNLVVGKSNRFFLPYSYKIFCHSKKIKKYPSKFKEKIFILSPLVRKRFYKNDKKHKSKFTLLIIGGSQGAKIFDQYFHEVLYRLFKKSNFKIIHQTSSNNINNLRNFYNKKKIINKVFDYDKKFSDIMKSCNFCITRAGASTLAELFVSNIPFLTIPLPNSKDNHQYENAMFYKRGNCCWILEENKINKMLVYKTLSKIFQYRKNINIKKKSMIKLKRKINWKIQNKILMKEFNEA